MRLLAPLGGLALVAGLIALMVSPASDDTGETPAEVVAYASSHEGWNVAILLFGVISIALGGMFVAGLHARLRAVVTEAEAALVLIGGIAFTLCFALCWIIWMAPLDDMPDDPARAIAQAEAYLGYDDVGWFLLGGAGVAAALMTVPASLAAMRAGLPSWLGWLGVWPASCRWGRSPSSACSPGWRGSPSRRSCCCCAAADQAGSSDRRGPSQGLSGHGSQAPVGDGRAPPAPDASSRSIRMRVSVDTRRRVGRCSGSSRSTPATIAVASSSLRPRRSTIERTSSETVQTCTGHRGSAPEAALLHRDGGRQASTGTCQTETWSVLSAVNGSRRQSPQRCSSVIPASRAIRSSSDGHT